MLIVNTNPMALARRHGRMELWEQRFGWAPATAVFGGKSSQSPGKLRSCATWGIQEAAAQVLYDSGTSDAHRLQLERCGIAGNLV